MLLTTWAPRINAIAKSITASADGSTIYVAGSFTQASGTGGAYVTRNRVASFTASTGALTAFNPNAGYRVNDIALSGNTAYLAGQFTTMGAASRTRLAAVNATTGAVLPWAPTANLEVRAIVAPEGSGKIVIGGNFTEVNGEQVRGMGALDPVTGGLMLWPVNQILVNYGADASIFSLVTNGTSVFGTGVTYLVNNDPTTAGNLEGTFFNEGGFQKNGEGCLVHFDGSGLIAKVA